MTHSWKSFQQRWKLLSIARELARSGQHSNYRSIIAQLESLDGFEEARGRRQVTAFRLHLDRVCPRTRADPVPRRARA